MPSPSFKAFRRAEARAAPAFNAEAFLESVTSLLLPVVTTTQGIDWIAATDVTPEHTGQRAGADKALAALVGAKPLILKTKAFLAKEKQLDEVSRVETSQPKGSVRPGSSAPPAAGARRNSLAG